MGNFNDLVKEYSDALKHYSSNEDNKKLAKEMEHFEEMFGDVAIKGKIESKIEGDFTTNIKDMKKSNK